MLYSLSLHRVLNAGVVRVYYERWDSHSVKPKKPCLDNARCVCSLHAGFLLLWYFVVLLWFWWFLLLLFSDVFQCTLRIAFRFCFWFCFLMVVSELSHAAGELGSLAKAYRINFVYSISLCTAKFSYLLVYTALYLQAHFEKIMSIIPKSTSLITRINTLQYKLH